jgi:hypothetical protein
MLRRVRPVVAHDHQVVALKRAYRGVSVFDHLLELGEDELQQRLQLERGGNVVRDIQEGGQLARALLHSLLEQLIGLDPLGDVFHHGNGEHRPAGGIPGQRLGEAAPHHAPIPANVALLKLVVLALPLDQPAEERQLPAEVLGMGELGEGHSTQLLGAVPQELL